MPATVAQRRIRSSQIHSAMSRSTAQPLETLIVNVGGRICATSGQPSAWAESSRRGSFVMTTSMNRLPPFGAGRKAPNLGRLGHVQTRSGTLSDSSASSLNAGRVWTHSQSRSCGDHNRVISVAAWLALPAGLLGPFPSNGPRCPRPARMFARGHSMLQPVTAC